MQAQAKKSTKPSSLSKPKKAPVFGKAKRKQEQAVVVPAKKAKVDDSPKSAKSKEGVVVPSQSKASSASSKEKRSKGNNDKPQRSSPSINERKEEQALVHSIHEFLG